MLRVETLSTSRSGKKRLRISRSDTCGVVLSPRYVDQAVKEESRVEVRDIRDCHLKSIVCEMGVAWVRYFLYLHLLRLSSKKRSTASQTSELLEASLISGTT